MKEEQESGKKTTENITDILDATKKGIGIAGTAAKAMEQTLPPPLGKIGKIAGIVSGVIKDPANNWVEKTVCGTAKVLAQGAAAAPLVGQAAAQGAAAMPVPHPYAKAAGAVIGAAAAGYAIAEVTRPVGEAAGKACHAAFGAFKAENRKQEAQQKIHEKHHQAQVINSFKPHIPTTIPLAKTQSFHTPYTPLYHRPFHFHIPFNTRIEVNRILLSYPNLSCTDRMYIERRVESSLSFANMGFGYALGASSFHSTLSMTGLISSYNSYNIQSLVHEAIRSCGSIGGVAGDVAVIEDLVDSEAHAMAEEYFFCFKATAFPFDPSLIKQIEKELDRNFFVHKTLPFFSLHFNNQGFLYPVIHPAWADTLTGKIIAILDYWMKGFLNGGIFDEAFLKQWHELQNCDENHLREHLTDLKKYCREKVKDVAYLSLRELESRYGLKTEKAEASSAYNQPFMTSFRIIAFQEGIKRHGNILLPSPDFRVEYSIDMMPDYKDYIEKYHKEHGEYPKDYENIRRCYGLYAEEITEKLPKMPFCRDYFHLLGMINAYCYAFTTFEKMGKRPLLQDSETQGKSDTVPKAFPPFPVRRFDPLDLPLTFGMIAENMPEAERINAALLELFINRQIPALPENLLLKIKTLIQQLLQTEVGKKLASASFEMNEGEIERITQQTERFIHAQIVQTHAGINRSLSRCLQRIAANEVRSISRLPLPKKLEAAEALLHKQMLLIKTRWEQSEDLSLPEILEAFTENWHPAVKKTFEKLETDLKAELEFLLFSCKKAAGTLTTTALQKPPLPPTAQHEKLGQKFILEFQELLSLFDQQAARETLHHQEEMQKGQDLLQNRQALINSAQLEINKLQQHKNTQIGTIPGHLRAWNAANIASFSAPIDQEIQRIQGLIASFQQDMLQINQDLTQISAVLASIPAKKLLKQKEASESMLKDLLKNFQEKSIQTKKAAYKDQALHLLEEIHADNSAKILNFQTIIRNFYTTLTKDAAARSHVISKKYTHSWIDFASNNPGDSFKIVGGCGMSLPNLRSQTLENGEAFSQALEKALRAGEVEFTFEKQKYQISSMQVRDVRKTEATAKETEHVLKGLMTGELDPESVAESIKMQPVDPSGSRLMHYASAVLDAGTFKTLAGSEILKTDFQGNTVLHYAAQAGNSEVAREILNKHPELLECKNQEGLTALFMAVQHGHLEMLKLLTGFHSNINLRLPNGLFPLYVAIQKNQEAIASWMLESIPHLAINEEIDSKMTALHLAIEAGFETLAQLLVNKAANCSIKRKSDGFNAMHTAVSKGNIALLSAMAKQGVSLETRLESGKNALHIAAENGLPDCLDYLVGQKLDPDTKNLEGDTALIAAIKAGHLETAKKLAAITRVNLLNEQQQSASLLALQYGMPQVADILIERGESPETRDKKGLNYTYFLLRNGEESRFSALLEAKKIDPFQKYRDQSTLEIAAKYGQFLLVYDLLEAGLVFRQKAGMPALLEYAVMADESGYLQENTGTKTDYLPLAILAAKQGSARCLSWLVKKCLPESILIAALESGNVTILEMLLACIGDLNKVVDAKGNTALHLAAVNGFVDAIDPLLNTGADPALKNYAGQTAFAIAFHQGDVLWLKSLFKKTKPAEWPHSLWQQPEKPASGMQKVLATFGKRLPNRKDAVFTLEKKILASPIMTETQEQGLNLLKAFFEESNFDEAADFLEENPPLLKLFQSAEGADLLLRIFKNVHDFKNLLASESAEEKNFFSADRLLQQLKKSGFDPATQQGKNNVLLAMIRAENEEEACFRLTIFLRYFPESFLTLLKDEKASVMELALKLNLRMLFEAFDAALPSSHEEKSVNALQEAVKVNHYDLVETLLKRYPADSLNAQRQTPLMMAAVMNNVRIMELLLDRGALPDRQDIHGKNALHHALDHESEAAALSLIPLLRHKNQPDRQKKTPLMLAAAKGLLPVVHCLTELGDFRESFDKKGHNALHYAALFGQVKIIEYLVNQGYSPNQIEGSHPKKPEKDRKRSPLHLAAARGKEAAVRTLLAFGADPKQEDSLKNTLCEHAIRSNNEATWQLIQTLPVYHERERDVSLLLAAAAADHLEMAAILILGDANLNASDQAGLGALHLCAINNSANVAALLLQGEDIAVDARDLSGHTALHYAAQTGHVRLIALLCEAGSAVNALNSQKSTALFMACEKGLQGAVVSLLKYGADFSLANAQGITPGQIALLNGHKALAKMLKDLGDSSLSLEAVAQLPPLIKGRLMSEHPDFLQLPAEKAIRIGQALARNGLYRMQAASRTEALAVMNSGLGNC